ncbi:hypothetical protein FDP41_004019 [Naegleria fowleri]|uniref:RNA-dependent RNA polymerase n=1 Tax=Naegleria fowleri TaxID=5763 RepID=A0A6A5BRC2_NAEFO|nr:uncharacterized protein FDP41_004019 [Naegleria fowleri]KAF0976724.1 hypothetical protein FDP41_004019 [Naegleria fowleri]
MVSSLSECSTINSPQPVHSVSNVRRPKQVFIPPPKYQDAYQQMKRQQFLSLCRSYQRKSSMPLISERNVFSSNHNSQCIEPKENMECLQSQKKRKVEKDTNTLQLSSQGLTRNALADISLSVDNNCVSQNVTNKVFVTEELKKEKNFTTPSSTMTCSDVQKISTCHSRTDLQKKFLSQIEPHINTYLGKQIITNIDLGQLFLITDGLNHILGNQYPLIGKIHEGPNGGYFLHIDNDGLVSKQTSYNCSSIYQSYTRLGRILMSIGLGRAMLYLYFTQEYVSSHAHDVEHICKHGIVYNGTRYKLFTSSNSSLCSRTGLSLFISSHINHVYLVSMLGNFSEAAKKGPRKALSRLALNSGKSFFSRKQLLTEELFILDDEQDYPGVDGCGFAREDYFRDILIHTEKQPFLYDGDVSRFIDDSEIDHIVAMQFRVGGFKGVLQAIPMKFWNLLQQKYGFNDQVRCVMRKSMQKFVGNTNIYSNFDVLEVSRIFGGSINLHFMSCMLQLTSKREEMEKIFLTRLDEYLVEKLCLDPENRSQLKHSSVLNDVNSSTTFDQDSIYSKVKSLLLAGHRLDNPFIHKWIMKRIERKCQSLFFNHFSLKFKIKKCINLIGIIDETGKLGPNQVFIACLKIRNILGERDYHNLQHVIVYRNPLAYQGDIMKLEIVKTLPNTFTAEEAEYLSSRENVIVFPKCYKQKSIHQFMGGGDLDGDRYVIIFDQEIIALFDKESPKVDYDSHTSIETNKPVSHHDIINEHVNCIIHKDNLISEIFYCNMLVRESDDIELKKLLAKALADAIDSKRAHLMDFRKLILETKQKFKEPAWYLESSKVKVSEGRLFDGHTFEFRMMNLIIETYSSIKYQPNYSAIDKDLIFKPVKRNAMLEQKWKAEFYLAHNQWTEYWIHFCCAMENKSTTSFAMTNFSKNNLKEKMFQKSLRPFLDEYFNSTLQDGHSNHDKQQDVRHTRNTTQHDYWKNLFHSGGLLSKDAPSKASIWLQTAYELEQQRCDMKDSQELIQQQQWLTSQWMETSTSFSTNVSQKSTLLSRMPQFGSFSQPPPQTFFRSLNSQQEVCHTYSQQPKSRSQQWNKTSLSCSRKSILSSPFLYYC